jgi:hypothetical protein
MNKGLPISHNYVTNHFSGETKEMNKGITLIKIIVNLLKKNNENYANIWNDTLNNVFQTNEVVIKFNLSKEEMEV